MTPADQPGVEGIMSEADYYYLYGNADGYTAYSILARELVRLADAVRDDKTPLDSCYSTDTVAFLRHIVLTRACQPVSALRAPVAAQERQEPVCDCGGGAGGHDERCSTLNRLEDSARAAPVLFVDPDDFAEAMAGELQSLLARTKPKGHCKMPLYTHPAPAAQQDELLRECRGVINWACMQMDYMPDEVAELMVKLDAALSAARPAGEPG